MLKDRDQEKVLEQERVSEFRHTGSEDTNAWIILLINAISDSRLLHKYWQGRVADPK